MTGWPELADRLALAILEHGPTAGHRLAQLVGVRRADIDAALKVDWRFERAGAGRSTRWTLATAPWDEKGRDSTEVRREAVDPALRARLRAIEARLDALERRLDEAGAPAE